MSKGRSKGKRRTEEAERHCHGEAVARAASVCSDMSRGFVLCVIFIERHLLAFLSFSPFTPFFAILSQKYSNAALVYHTHDGRQYSFLGPYAQHYYFLRPLNVFYYTVILVTPTLGGSRTRFSSKFFFKFFTLQRMA